MFPNKAISIRVSDTVEFRHNRVTVSAIKPEDRVKGANTQLKADSDALPSPNANNQIVAIDQIHGLFATRNIMINNKSFPQKKLHSLQGWTVLKIWTSTN